MEKERTVVHDHGNAQPQIGRSVYEMCTCHLSRQKKKEKKWEYLVVNQEMLSSREHELSSSLVLLP